MASLRKRGSFLRISTAGLRWAQSVSNYNVSKTYFPFLTRFLQNA